jgi:hypothetical protein
MDDRENQAAGSAAEIAVYAAVGENYRAIDDLRLRLLALLPLATGTGIFVLLQGDGPSGTAGPVGLFGMAVTVSLYFYEVHGIEKCAHFIHRGRQLEAALGVRGSFTDRPHHVLGVVSELLPSMIIYPASFAGWAYLAMDNLDGQWLSVDAQTLGTVAAFVAAVALSTITITKLERTRAQPEP